LAFYRGQAPFSFSSDLKKTKKANSTGGKKKDVEVNRIKRLFFRRQIMPDKKGGD